MSAEELFTAFLGAVAAGLGALVIVGLRWVVSRLVREMQENREFASSEIRSVNARLDLVNGSVKRHDLGIVSDGQRISYLEGLARVTHKAGELPIPKE